MLPSEIAIRSVTLLDRLVYFAYRPFVSEAVTAVDNSPFCDVARKVGQFYLSSLYSRSVCCDFG